MFDWIKKLFGDKPKEKIKEGFNSIPNRESVDHFIAPPPFDRIKVELKPYRSLSDEVLVLLNHIELVVDEENWEKIDTKLWNAVTVLATPSRHYPSLKD